MPRNRRGAGIERVFYRAREASRKTQCISNLSQLGKAFRMYLQDWQDSFPPSFDITQPAFSWVAYGGVQDDGPRMLPEEGVLYPYVRNTSVYICPSDMSASITRLSYGMNTQLGLAAITHQGEILQLYAVGESMIYDPSRLALLLEKPYGYYLFFSPAFIGGCREQSPNTSHPCFDERTNIGWNPNWPDVVACRHNRTTNVLFCDGHVKTFSENGLACRYTSRELHGLPNNPNP